MRRIFQLTVLDNNGKRVRHSTRYGGRYRFWTEPAHVRSAIAAVNYRAEPYVYFKKTIVRPEYIRYRDTCMIEMTEIESHSWKEITPASTTAIITVLTPEQFLKKFPIKKKKK